MAERRKQKQNPSIGIKNHDATDVQNERQQIQMNLLREDSAM